MDERVVQFRVGVVVLATLLVAAILVFLFGELSFWPFAESTKTVHIVFPRAPGVSVETPVRKSGITIGRVTAVQLTPEGQALVSARLKDQYAVWKNDTVQIAAASLLGDTFIEFVQAEKPGPPLADGETIAGAVAPGLQEIIVRLEDNMTNTIDSLGRAGDEVAILAGRVNTMLGDDERIQRITEKSELALDNFNKMMGNLDRAAMQLDDLLGDEQLRAGLRDSLSQLPDLMNETRVTMQRLQKAATTADQNLTDLRGFTEPLGRRGEVMLQRVESSVTQIDELMSQLVEFSRSINSREGSLGQLVHNPDLYQRLNRAAGNIEDASQRLRPILNDVRVFTDKIARDPGRIGVSGVLRRESGIK